MKTDSFSRRGVILGGVSATVLPQVVWGQEREVEGGIGGTGIVGLLTDFGSLIVAGRYVKTDQQTIVTDAFGRISESDLARGDSLTVEAAGPQDGLVARRVHLTHPLVGQITAQSGNSVVINGVEVFLDAASPLAQVGQRVAVSGLWRGTGVVASRLSPARADLDLVAGDVSRDTRGTQVGGVRAISAQLSRQQDGSFAAITGRYDPASGRFTVQRLQSERFLLSAGPLRRLAVEGFLQPTPRAPGYRISGLGHSFSRTLDLASFAGPRVLFSGPYVGTFAADRALILPQDREERRRTLGAMAR